MTQFQSSIIGYWPLAGDANSGGGTITDALTGVNSPTFESVAGIGTMAKLDRALSQRLILADSAPLNLQGVNWWGYCAFVRASDIGAAAAVVSQFGGANNRAWSLEFSAANALAFTFRDSADVGTTLFAGAGNTPAVGVVGHAFFGLQLRDDGNWYGFLETNGAFVSTASLGSNYTIANPTHDVQVGARTSTAHFNGHIARFALGKLYVPTPRERAWIRKRPQFFAFADVFRNQPKRHPETLMA